MLVVIVEDFLRVADNFLVLLETLFIELHNLIIGEVDFLNEHRGHINVVGFLNHCGNLIFVGVDNVGKRLVNNVDDAEQYQERQKRRQAARSRLIALLLELCELVLLFLGVVFVFCLNLPDLWRKNGGFCRGFLLFDVNREKSRFYDEREEDYCNSDVLANKVINRVKHITKRRADNTI